MTPRTRVLLLGALLVVVAGVYAQAAGAPFYWDDRKLLLDNPVVQGGSLAAAWTGDLWGGISHFWRPLVVHDFQLDWALFGAHATGWHLHSLLWHLAATAAVAVLAGGRLGFARGLVAAAIFALHPIQNEAVLWIAARNDLMVAAGVLGGLAAADRRASAWVVAAFTAVAVLSKEAGIVFPVLLVGWRLAWGDRPERRHLVASLAVCVAAVAGRIWAVGPALPSTSENASGFADVWRQLLVFPLSWVTVPWPLTTQESVRSPVTMVSWIGAGLTVALVVAVVRAAPRRGLWLLGLALLCWSPSLPVSVTSALIGERYLYLPVAFVAIAVAAAAPARAWAYAAGGAWVLAALVVLGVRMSEWTSELRLLDAAVRRSDNPAAWGRFGALLDEAGFRDDAVNAWLHGVRSPSPWYRACAEPVRILGGLGRFPEAAALSDELADEGCLVDDPFTTVRVRALVSVGRYDDARALLGWLRERGRGLGPKDLPLRGALCLADGDYACVHALRLRFREVADPTTFDQVVFDLLHAEGVPVPAPPYTRVPRPAPRPGPT